MMMSMRMRNITLRWTITASKISLLDDFQFVYTQTGEKRGDAAGNLARIVGIGDHHLDAAGRVRAVVFQLEISLRFGKRA